MPLGKVISSSILPWSLAIIIVSKWFDFVA